METDIGDRPNTAEAEPPPGPRPTFEAAVLPLTDELYRRAYAYTRNASDAEDLVQETLLKAYRAFDALGENAHHKAWLLRILRNAWITAYRASQCRPAENLVGYFDDDRESTLSARAHQAHSAEHIVLRDIPHPRLEAALSALPESVRLTVYYIAIEGMSHREVAGVMGVPKGTVMSRMHRGRHRLRHCLDGVPGGTA
jgi:RNA polymerase sigma-70 factor (ECF subfamily)